ncbi:MAG: (2Fe-2S)-binding protein [Burkholderiales bacterium]|nr:(2Fe-2S)-binding protein [Burkholderiales bacterium]
MIICICHRVSDRDIAHAVAGGCKTFDELQEATRAGTGCGACTEFAAESFAAHRGGGCCAHLCSPGTSPLQATLPAAPTPAPAPTMAAA